MDTIIYIEDGEIKEKGSHEQLMQKRGFYYNLYQIQHIQETAPLEKGAVFSFIFFFLSICSSSSGL